MTALHYGGTLAVLLLISVLGMYAGTRVKSAGDFTVGNRRAGAAVVAGSIIGTMVGGASTIGTAELAFSYGFSAWWFTLGGGVACVVLGCLYVPALHASGVTTLPQLLAREYGRNAATTATLLTSLGSFLSIVSQVLAGVALVTSVTNIAPIPAAMLIVVLMLAYVLFGGIWGAGMVGIAKTLLLYGVVAMCGAVALEDWDAIRVLPETRYFSLFARGPALDVGAGLSLVLGILTTQAYIQTVIAAGTARLARIGVFISAALIPLIGIAGILVGLHMRVHMPDIAPAAALPVFILRHMPPFFGGVALATLLVTVMGTAAGVALGVSSMFCNDIWRVYRRPPTGEAGMLVVARMSLLVVLSAAALVGMGNAGSMILGWSFMSMGLRGAVAFGAFTAAIFVPGRIPPAYATASMFLGPLCMLSCKPFVGNSLDPLFPGVAAGLLILAVGYLRDGRGRAENETRPRVKNPEQGEDP
jgi:SSS family solute:Na+ symporter